MKKRVSAAVGGLLVASAVVLRLGAARAATFWPANRPCPGADPNDDTCSGVSQQAWDFTRIFARDAG